MELVKGGSLKQLLIQKKETGKKFTDDDVSTMLRAILRAVEYLHHKNIIHRDLKPGLKIKTTAQFF
jgi:calcium/calmodulin-dependent protein kinase I